MRRALALGALSFVHGCCACYPTHQDVERSWLDLVPAEPAEVAPQEQPRSPPGTGTITFSTEASKVDSDYHPREIPAGDGCNWILLDKDGNGYAMTTVACSKKKGSL